MKLYYEQFSKNHHFDCHGGPLKYLVLATTPRSGSHMVGHSLYATGLLGFPLEYANPANLKEWKRLLNTKTLDSTMERLKGVRTSPNGVFSQKLHYDQLTQFRDFSHFEQMFPEAKFVLISRRNLVKQAVSYAIAIQTEVWIEGQVGNGMCAQYDFSLTDRCLRKIVSDNAAWKYLLSASGSLYIEMDFETAVDDMKLAVSRICDFMSEDFQLSNLEDLVLTKPQSNELNEEWQQRFVREHSGKNLL